MPRSSGISVLQALKDTLNFADVFWALRPDKQVEIDAQYGTKRTSGYQTPMADFVWLRLLENSEI